MKKQFNLSIVAVAAASVFCSTNAMAEYYDPAGSTTTAIYDWVDVYISGNNNSSSDLFPQGVFITSNSNTYSGVADGPVAVNRAYLEVLTNGNANVVGTTAVNITSPLTTVNGALTVTGASTTAGISNTGDISNTGNITNGGTLDVTGGTTLRSTLDVTGATNINTTGTAATRIGTAGGNTTIGNVSSTNTIAGATSINALIVPA